MGALTSSPVQVAPRADRAAPRVFRYDIQGLRAIAVVLVVLNHAGVTVLGGGYVGVDVFFVISGFLITGHLITSLREHGRVNLHAFYAARARRILPASLAVIALTSAAAFVLVSPLRIADILRDAVVSALYVPNISFAVQGTDYLAGSAPSPFQHFWSLGVEEQFYLFWPVILIALFFIGRRSPRRLAVGIAIVAVASFAACLIVADVSQPWAFFSLPTRAWELAAGALLAAGAPQLARVVPGVARILTWLGLGVILCSSVLLTEATAYPGIATVIPVLGAALVIGFGGRDERGAVLALRSRPFQFLGAISYSLYLVHWPMLVLAQERLGPGAPLPLAVTLALAVLSVPVAWAMYRLVETPFRRGSARSLLSHRKTIAASIAGSLVLSGALVGAEAASALMPLDSGRTAAAVAPQQLPVGTAFVPAGLSPTLAESRADTGEIYANGCQQGLSASEVLTCSFGDLSSPTVVALFGDSHAGRWFPAVREAADGLGFRLDTYTKSGCRSQETDAAWDASTNNSCTQWRADAVAALNAAPPDVIIVTNHIGPRADRNPVEEQQDWEQAVQSTIDRLPAESHIVMLADTPEFASSPVLCLSANLDSALECAVARAQAFNDPVAAAQRIVADESGASFLDFSDWFCDDSLCPAVIGSTLVYSDEHHLTATWSKTLGPAVQAELARLSFVDWSGSERAVEGETNG
ncbi:acyltransferase family protein [Salinibacterium sp. ZJ450]|uniref:acyltransferase family protein n=1 Tax=Salinibacterium sp. ZJ450 TaxID=2708338 RepID=UPI001421DD90|nr:acyltransferase family protein [Salinibacterium sp. ZJ450]